MRAAIVEDFVVRISSRSVTPTNFWAWK